MTAVGAELYESLGPWYREDQALGIGYSYRLQDLAEACIAGLQLVDDVARDSDAGPGWSQAVDPVRAPADWLPWLAQMAGTRIPAGLAEAAVRSLIRTRPGSSRGTLRSLVSAIQDTLTGGKSVSVLERVTSAYTATVITRPSETPEAPVAKTLSNPSFETDASGWAYAATATVSSWSRVAFTFSGSDGSFALRQIATATAGQYMRSEMTSRFAVTPNRSYKARIAGRVGNTAAAGTVARVAIAWYDSNGNFISESVGSDAAAASVAIINPSVIGLAPANAATASVRAYHVSGGTGSLDMIWDYCRVDAVYGPTWKAIMDQKPGGIVLTHVVSDNAIWDESTLAWNAVNAAKTWNNVASGDT